MTIKQEIKQLINEVIDLKDRGRINSYIEYIRFPLYKNIDADQIISFDSPFTVYTGPNGSGKSSALHALYGCPDGYSTGNFWFSTRVDPITEGSDNPNCFIYGYKNGGDEILEVLKTRIRRENNPDYWEPSRPIKKYGMKLLGGRRNPALKKSVVYLDFRSELSAFDKYFYFTPFHSSTTLKTKQDVVRKYSKYLKQIIDENMSIIIRGIRKNESAINLSTNELKVISKILGKEYSTCKLINHSLFPKTEGLSIYFTSDTFNYSEAFAGRGEFAVVKLVHEISKAQDNSLIILDEPEVSLHPRAQEELKKYLLQQIKRKGIQVVISTHSPTFVEGLPDSAIKLFYQNADRKISIKNTCNFMEAFQQIGIDLPNDSKSVIIVEDITVKLLLEALLKDLGAEWELIFTIKFFPGGAEEILKKAATYTEEGEMFKFLFLDGDKTREKINPNSYSVTNANDFEFVKSEILKLTNIGFDKLGFRLNSSHRNEETYKLAISLKYLNFLFTNLSYLPGQIPEDILWDEEYAAKILELTKNLSVDFQGTSKDKIYQFTINMFGEAGDNNMSGSIKMFIQNFIKNKSGFYITIFDALKSFKEFHLQRRFS